jgi:hypothetical protein
MNLNSKIVNTIPRQTIQAVGDALGILRNGILVFQSQDMTSVLMDCCVYDWFEDGKNVIQRYSETHPAKPGTDEGYLLEAGLQAKYRVLVVESAAPGAGVHCRDVMHGEELFLMDLGLSQAAGVSGAALATRTIPLGEYWMTSGAALPINSGDALKAALRRAESGKWKWAAGPGIVSLRLVRACLETGAAEHVAYEDPGSKPGKARRRR